MKVPLSHRNNSVSLLRPWLGWCVGVCHAGMSQSAKGDFATPSPVLITSRSRSVRVTIACVITVLYTEYPHITQQTYVPLPPSLIQCNPSKKVFGAINIEETACHDNHRDLISQYLTSRGAMIFILRCYLISLKCLATPNEIKSKHITKVKEF